MGDRGSTNEQAPGVFCRAAHKVVPTNAKYRDVLNGDHYYSDRAKFVKLCEGPHHVIYVGPEQPLPTTTTKETDDE